MKRPESTEQKPRVQQFERSEARTFGAIAVQGRLTEASTPSAYDDRDVPGQRTILVTGIDFAPKRTQYDSFGLIAYHEEQQRTSKKQ